jgi:hypothetical protein
MFVSRPVAPLLPSFKIRRPHLCPPRPPELDRTQPLDFMLATLVGNGAARSVATLPAIKVNSHLFRRLVKVRCWAFSDLTGLADDARC